MSAADGSDTAHVIGELFRAMNTPIAARAHSARVRPCRPFILWPWIDPVGTATRLVLHRAMRQTMRMVHAHPGAP